MGYNYAQLFERDEIMACSHRRTNSTHQRRKKKESDDKYADQLEEWESKNHQILTWFANTIVLPINVHFGRFELAKEVWDFLATRYNSTTISHQYHLMTTLSQL